MIKKDTGSTPLKIGFLGLGWIGRMRMESLIQTGLAEATVVADTNVAQLMSIQTGAPFLCHSLDELLSVKKLDGVVVATPSALHAEQVSAVLKSGLPVFCQKPLGRNRDEVKSILQIAKSYNRLLSIDFSYRYLSSVKIIQRLLDENVIGDVFSVKAVFHNAYGPDKPWFYNPELSGGGCVIDLGIHLVDIVLYLLHFPDVINVSSRLYSKGRRLRGDRGEVEDFALARLDLAGGICTEIACSWKLSAGTDAEIGVWFYGSKGSLCFHNVNGSFYDFVGEHSIGTVKRVICEPPDNWGGRAIENWAQKLTKSSMFDDEVSTVETVSSVIDKIYKEQY